MMAGAGAIWCWASIPDGRETLLCGLVGAGFALVAWGLGPDSARRRLLFVGGFVLAALASGTWTVWTLAAGNLPLRWGLFGLGVVAAAVLAAGSVLWAWRAKTGLRIAFGVVLAATVNLVVSDPSLTLYAAGLLLSVLAAALLVIQPPLPMRASPAASTK
jgi:hypothetical protein